MGTKIYHGELNLRPKIKIRRNTYIEYVYQLQIKEMKIATEATKQAINNKP